MIPTKTIVDKANAEITAGSITDLEYTQLAGTDVFLDRVTPKSAANVAVLPAAANNEGIIYYVSNEAVYYFSDGTNWRKDFTSDYEVSSIITYGWGYNSFGNVGDNTTSSRSSPVTVVGGITTWSQVSAGNHSLGLTSTGIAYAWGGNNNGKLGDGTTTSRPSPVTIAGGITNWTQLTAGDVHSLGLTATGIAYAWGFNYASGQLGDGTTTGRTSPVTVVGGITTWSQLSAGRYHSLGLTSAGIAYAWGRNNNAQLGDNTTSNKSSPVTVIGGITNWSQVSAGTSHNLGLTSSGVAYAWGQNTSGRLGDNTTSNRSSPVTVVGGITNWSQLSAGYSHNLGVTATGIAYAWGRSDSGQLGDNTTSTRSSPVTVIGGITNWNQLSGGLSHSLGLTSTGIAYAWGANSNGKLGDNTTTNRSSPVTVVGSLSNWSQLSAGYHSLGIRIQAQYTKGFV